VNFPQFLKITPGKEPLLSPIKLKIPNCKKNFKKKNFLKKEVLKPPE